jgi:hypothetical protein
MALIIFIIALSVFSLFVFFLGIDHMIYHDFGIGIVLILLGLVLGFTVIISLL